MKSTLLPLVLLALVPLAVSGKQPIILPIAADAAPEGKKPADANIRLTAESLATNGVSLATVQPQSLTRTLSVFARVTLNAEATAQVAAPLHGRISEWKVRIGDEVKKGDALAVIYSPELGEAQSEYLHKQSATTAAVASVELAKAIWTRSQGVYEKTRGITLTQVQQREAEYQALLITQQSADAAALAAARKLQLLGMESAAVAALIKSGELSPQYLVRAPQDGQILQRDAALGELVGPERAALLVMADLSRNWVIAEVPEAQIHDLALGAKAWLQAVDASVTEEGRITYLAPVVDEAARTVKVRIEGGASKLRPGSFIRAELATTGVSAAVLAVPEEAVHEVDGKNVVFVPVKGEANTFALRSVTTGAMVTKMVPILSGLADGESYVAKGSFILKAAHKVAADAE